MVIIIRNDGKFQEWLKKNKLKASILSILGTIDLETLNLCPLDCNNESSKLIARAGFFMFVFEVLFQLIIQVSFKIFFFWLIFYNIFIYFFFLFRSYLNV
jgi:hypothetical protein